MSKQHRNQPPDSASPAGELPNLETEFAETHEGEQIAPKPLENTQNTAKNEPKTTETAPPVPKQPILDEKTPQPLAQQQTPPGNDQQTPTAAETVAPPDEHAADAAISGGTTLQETPAPRLAAVDIRLPVCAPEALPTSGYQARRRNHVEVQLTPVQAQALRHVYHGLDAANERLTNGTRVFKRPDAVKWLLDQIALQVPECQQLQDEIDAREAARLKKLADERARKEEKETAVA